MNKLFIFNKIKYNPKWQYFGNDWPHFLVFVISKIILKHKDDTKQYLLKNYEKHFKIKPKNYIESSNTVVKRRLIKAAKWLSIPPYLQLLVWSSTVLEAFCDTTYLGSIRAFSESLYFKHRKGCLWLIVEVCC